MTIKQLKMRFTKTRIDDIPLLIEEHQTGTSPHSSSYREGHSALQCHSFREDQMGNSMDKRTSPAEYIYTEIVKNLGNNEFLEEKRLLKRASWSPAARQDHGLPPTGKRPDHDQTTSQRNSNRVRLRPKVARFYNPKPTSEHHTPSGRPASFNDRYDCHLIERKSPHSPLVSSEEDCSLIESRELKSSMIKYFRHRFSIILKSLIDQIT